MILESMKKEVGKTEVTLDYFVEDEDWVIRVGFSAVLRDLKFKKFSDGLLAFNNIDGKIISQIEEIKELKGKIRWLEMSINDKIMDGVYKHAC